MSDSIPAIFESGVLRPLVPLGLHEGDVVNLRISTAAEWSTTSSLIGDQRAMIESLLVEAEALPPEGALEAFSGRDHDSALYGER